MRCTQFLCSAGDVAQVCGGHDGWSGLLARCVEASGVDAAMERGRRSDMDFGRGVSLAAAASCCACGVRSSRGFVFSRAGELVEGEEELLLLEEFDSEIDAACACASSVLSSESASCLAAASFFACLACLCLTPLAFLASTPALVWSTGARGLPMRRPAALHLSLYLVCETAIFPFRISSVCSMCMPAWERAALSIYTRWERC